MNISDTDLECPARARPYQPADLTRAAEPPKRAAAIRLLGNSVVCTSCPRRCEDRRASIEKAAYLRAERRGVRSRARARGLAGGGRRGGSAPRR